jgi:hypothetical protein
MKDLNAAIPGIGNVDAVGGIDPYTGGNIELLGSKATSPQDAYWHWQSNYRPSRPLPGVRMKAIFSCL